MTIMEKKLRIAFVITGLGMGGAENQVVNLCDQLAARGHSVLLVAMSGPKIVSPTNPDITVVCLGLVKTPLSFLLCYLEAGRLLREFKPDIVHSHMVHANLFARFLRLWQRFPGLICTAHSSNEGGWLRTAMYGLTDRIADLTTNVSHDGVDRFVKIRAVPARKIRMVPNGIDCERFHFDSLTRPILRAELNCSGENFIFLAVGRFAPEKDYPNLLYGFKTVAERVPSARLWIAGEGPEKAGCIALTAQLGIADRVDFLGIRRDVPELMSAADAFVLSSKIEGLPLVVGEAMACERMVVTTDAGGVREFVGDAGLIVSTNDAARLAEAMITVASLPVVTRRQKGQRGRAHIEQNYSLSAVVTQWVNVYLAI